MPEVSLITSWAVPQYIPGKRWLQGLSIPLQHGVDVLDLYFLDHSDIGWYIAVLAEAAAPRWLDRQQELEALHRPEAFAAALTRRELDIIAKRLREGLWEALLEGGAFTRLVGRRPRFGCLATFFPNLSHPDQYAFETAVKAVRAAVYLARQLGCHCVEAVGGCGFDRGAADWSEEQRTQRLGRLAEGIRCVYDEGWQPVQPAPRRARGRTEEPEPSLAEYWHEPSSNRALPPLALELEPGESFLINELPRFVELLQALCATEQAIAAHAHERCLLNLDVAHALLLDLKVEKLREVASFGRRTLPLTALIGHMHISDHAGDTRSGGSHGSDMVPGRFHLYDEHYRPWLEVAMELCDPTPRSLAAAGQPEETWQPRFSRVIAVEMEACNDVAEAMAAWSTTCRWVYRTAQAQERQAKQAHRGTTKLVPEAPEYAWHEGAIAVYDLARSTESLFVRSLPTDPGNHTPDAVVATACLEFLTAQLCEQVHRQGGAMMSFTGDGLIAFYELPRYAGAHDAGQAALDSVIELRQNSAEFAIWNMALRAALHWGRVYIPTSGRLRDQALGDTVVTASRLCQHIAWMEDHAENDQFQWKPEDRWRVVATREFYHALHKAPPPDFVPDPTVQFRRIYTALDLRGLPTRYEVYALGLERRPVPETHTAEAPKATPEPRPAVPSKGQKTRVAAVAAGPDSGPEGVPTHSVRSPRRLTWLHLSDLHLRTGHQYPQDRVLKALLQAVKEYRTAKGRPAGPITPDVIFVTGDIAFSGQAGEYARATKFLDDLLKAAALDNSKLVVVPGNHDVDRTRGTALPRTLAEQATHPSQADAESSEYFAEESAKPHKAKFEAFAQWYGDYFGRHRPDSGNESPVLPVYDDATTVQMPLLLELAGLKVAVLPINSAWFSMPDDRDMGKLWVGRRPLDEALEAGAETLMRADLRLALMHHPPEHLHGDERGAILSTLQRTFDVLLTGHLHEVTAQQVSIVDGDLLRVASGACYQATWPKLCLYGEVDLAAGDVGMLPLRYEDTPRPLWTVDTSLWHRSPDYWGRFNGLGWKSNTQLQPP